jgi:N4-gp56 family major capsid protein
MSGNVWVVNTLGGYMFSLNLSDELRIAVQPKVKFRQFCDIKDASQQGKKKGDIFTWDVYQDVATRAVSSLVETATMPETNYTIVQGTLTMAEGGNSVPYSGKLDDLSKHPVKTIIQKVLKNDATKWFDAKAHSEFNRTSLRVVPASSGTSTTTVSLTTNGTCTGTNNIALRGAHVKLIVDIMKERNIPPYQADDYYALGWPSTYRSLKNDLEAIHQYTGEGLTMIMNGEIGRYENVRFVEQTNVPKGGAADTTTFDAFANVPDAWNNAASDWVFFFGDDTVAEAIAVPEEMRGKIPTDYGRSKGVAWYYLGGFGRPVQEVGRGRGGGIHLRHGARDLHLARREVLSARPDQDHQGRLLRPRDAGECLERSAHRAHPYARRLGLDRGGSGT